MATQLQAKNRGYGNDRYPVTMDGPTKSDADWLIQFAQDNLNVNPSLTVVVRAALSHYRSFLMAQATCLGNLEMLTQFIQENRDLLFFVSGRPEQAYDRRYETMKGAD